MSSTIDSGANSARSKEDKCPKSPDGKHRYETTCGTWPSEERTCKYCGDRYYTK